VGGAEQRIIIWGAAKLPIIADKGKTGHNTTDAGETSK
jgi:hypothetical protein